MTQHTAVDEELERRLRAIETEESNDPVHARFGGRSLVFFAVVSVGIAVASFGLAAL